MTNEKFTKADIIDSLYQKTGMSPKDIRTIMDLFIVELKDALLRQQIIELRGFGTFEVKVRKGRPKARNPKTGETISVRSHGSAIFRPGRELKQAAWNISDETGISHTSEDIPKAEVTHTEETSGKTRVSLNVIPSGSGT